MLLPPKKNKEAATTEFSVLCTFVPFSVPLSATADILFLQFFFECCLRSLTLVENGSIGKVFSKPYPLATLCCIEHLGNTQEAFLLVQTRATILFESPGKNFFRHTAFPWPTFFGRVTWDRQIPGTRNKSFISVTQTFSGIP